MHTYIYLPSAGLLPKSLSEHPVISLVGYRTGNTYVVVDYFPSSSSDYSAIDTDLHNVGYIVGADHDKQLQHLPPVDLYLRYLSTFEYPGVDTKLSISSDSYTVVVFSPPKLRNLEYFTINPILLQGSDIEPPTEVLYRKVDRYRRHSEFNGAVYVSDETVLERINHCLEVRLKLQNSLADSQNRSLFQPKMLSFSKLLLYVFSVSAEFLIANALGLFVELIAILNRNFFGFVPVDNFSFCRQLDLRLRQLSFLPVQFLCYYKGDVLSERSRRLLKLSFPNENHNIKNSNYINFYNTVWLILNDMILGRVFYNVWKENQQYVPGLIQGIRYIVFGQLNSLISWVGSDHPAGFKLNNDLGLFMEAMLLWTSLSWQLVTDFSSQFIENVFVLNKASALIFNLLCFGGVSFVLAFAVDYINFICFHLHFFNISTTKIYNQQVEMLKSLMQLFRGKKYNVLRNRIDSIEEDDYRVDQLLLGTFCFMILIYLLPTTFAFYFLFFGAQLCLLTIFKLGEKLIVMLNFFPLFALMLKLKNSKRLQGGVYFERKGSCGATNWLTMRNRALTLDSILGPFVSVFRQQGRILRLFLNFIEGKRIVVQNCTPLKFKYLMLPGDYSQLMEVWENI